MDELYLYVNYILIQLLPKSEHIKSKPTSKSQGNVFYLTAHSALSVLAVFQPWHQNQRLPSNNMRNMQESLHPN